MTNNKNLLIILIVLIVVIIALAIIFSGKAPSQETNIEGGPENEEQEETNLEEVNVLNEIFAISGNVTEISENEITVYSLIPLEQDAEPVMKTLKIKINENTKITKIVTPDETGQPKESEITINDLEIDDVLDITFDENVADSITNGQTLTAGTIYLSE